MLYKHWKRERWECKRWNGILSGVVYDKSRCGLRKAMVEKKFVLSVLLCCFNTATTVNQVITEDYTVWHNSVDSADNI